MPRMPSALGCGPRQPHLPAPRGPRAGKGGLQRPRQREMLRALRRPFRHDSVRKDNSALSMVAERSCSSTHPLGVRSSRASGAAKDASAARRGTPPKKSRPRLWLGFVASWEPHSQRLLLLLLVIIIITTIFIIVIVIISIIVIIVIEIIVIKPPKSKERH